MEASAGPSGVTVRKKPIIDQICEAIKILGKPRLGASVQAIKKQILGAYEEPNHGRISTQINKAIAMGEKSGLLVRPARCKDCVGATGSFMVNSEKLKTITDKPQKHPDVKKNMKKLYQPEEDKAAEKRMKPKTTKPKIPKKKEKKDDKKDQKKDDSESEGRMVCSTPKNSDSEFEQQEPVKPKKKPEKTARKDYTFTRKKHASDSDLSDVKKTVKLKNLKEKSKTTTRNNKAGTSNTLKETEKETKVNNEKKIKRTLKTHNSDSVLM